MTSYVETKKTYYTPNWDFLQCIFSLNISSLGSAAGLGSFNNWNLKQNFLFLDATFEGPNGK